MGRQAIPPSTELTPPFTQRRIERIEIPTLALLALNDYTTWSTLYRNDITFEIATVRVCIAVALS